MKLFDVYPLFDITPIKGNGVKIWDKDGREYLDLYGGHAVISIGHSHPHYVKLVSEQFAKLGFYSNSIQNPLQHELAQKLGELSGRPDYQLFFCNSGAEANENALKLASFETGRKKMISFSGGFHGRTSLAVAVTDGKKITAPVNETENAVLLPFNDVEALKEAFETHKGEIAGVIVEGIQGLGGIQIPTPEFMNAIRSLCDQHGSLLIADSVQCGYGRSGKFFSHDFYGVDADVYTMAKGMGNGFPMGGIAIKPSILPIYGMLGTTFGGNHAACAAGIAVLDVIKEENLMENASTVGDYLMSELSKFDEIKEVRGRGLMIGAEFYEDASPIRKALLFDKGVFTGTSANKSIIRLLPPLNITKSDADQFLQAIDEVIKVNV